MLHRDGPEEQGLVFAAKIPTWGILRLRTNCLFPQVSLSLHRLILYLLPPCRLLAQGRRKGKNSSQDTPYISAFKGEVLRRDGYRCCERKQTKDSANVNTRPRECLDVPGDPLHHRSPLPGRPSQSRLAPTPFLGYFATYGHGEPRKTQLGSIPHQEMEHRESFLSNEAKYIYAAIENFGYA